MINATEVRKANYEKLTKIVDDIPNHLTPGTVLSDLYQKLKTIVSAQFKTEIQKS